jgi:hypothetical protein
MGLRKCLGYLKRGLLRMGEEALCGASFLMRLGA